MAATKSTKKLHLPYGYSFDKRKRRNQHRTAAKELRNEGGGGIIRSVIAWHLNNARYHGR